MIGIILSPFMAVLIIPYAVGPPPEGSMTWLPWVVAGAVSLFLAYCLFFQYLFSPHERKRRRLVKKLTEQYYRAENPREKQKIWNRLLKVMRAD